MKNLKDKITLVTGAVEPLVYDFNLSKLERVMSGAGKVAAVGHELERRGLKRTIVVTGKTLGGSALLEKVTGAAGARCVAVFKGARQHVPRSSVHELQALIERENADSLIGFGGGSPIDTCKVTSHPFLEKREIIQIAIPTTLSAAEYTYGGGVTDEKTLVKSVVSDPRLQPRTVINDPELTLETPEWLWVATAMRALDHAIETIYAKRHHPLSDALGAKAISLLVEHFKPSIEARHGRATRASRGMSIRGVVFDFWIGEHALRNFTSAGASDWAEMEHRAWDYVVHYPAPRYAVHGGNRA